MAYTLVHLIVHLGTPWMTDSTTPTTTTQPAIEIVQGRIEGTTIVAAARFAGVNDTTVLLVLLCRTSDESKCICTDGGTDPVSVFVKLRERSIDAHIIAGSSGSNYRRTSGLEHNEGNEAECREAQNRRSQSIITPDPDSEHSANPGPRRGNRKSRAIAMRVWVRRDRNNVPGNVVKRLEDGAKRRNASRRRCQRVAADRDFKAQK